MTDYFAIFERNIGIFTVEVKLIVYKDFGHGISRPSGITGSGSPSISGAKKSKFRSRSRRRQ